MSRWRPKLRLVMIGDSVWDTGRTNRPSDLAVATVSNPERSGWRTTVRAAGTMWVSPPRAIPTTRPPV